MIPRALAERLGLWPPPAGARSERFESPIASAAMISVPRALRVALTGSRRPPVVCNAVVAEHETEVVLDDWAVEALAIGLVAVGRGLYRVGRSGAIRKSATAEHR